MMSSKNPSEKLQLFEDSIRNQIESIRATERCHWCRDPNRPIYLKGLCRSCYRWEKKKRELSVRLAGLPPETKNDPHFLLREDSSVVDIAIELCQIEGRVFDARLDQVEPIELEEIFGALSRRVLGPKRGARLFHGHVSYFCEFSALQRVWLWNMVSKILFEHNHRNRLRLAYSNFRKRRNSKADKGL